jgi:hypothetical protein
MQVSRDDRTSQPRVVEETTRARQGVTGHNVRYVLIFGLAGVIIAFAIIYLMFFGHG